MNNGLSTRFFYILAILMLATDLFCFSFFEKPIIYALLCFYITQLLNPLPPIRVITVLALLSVESLLFYGRFFASLIYLIPITALTSQIKYRMYPAPSHKYILLVLALLAQLWLEAVLFHYPAAITSTIAKISANIGIMMLFFEIIW